MGWGVGGVRDPERATLANRVFTKFTNVKMYSRFAPVRVAVEIFAASINQAEALFFFAQGNVAFFFRFK